MNEDNYDRLMTWLTNQALDYKIGVEFFHGKPNFAAKAVPKYELVIINLNWRRPSEIPFMFAHELGHLLNHDDGWRYNESPTLHWQSEAHANRTGIQILWRYCQANDLALFPAQFCSTFGVPEAFLTAVVSVLRPTVKFNP